ncbi:MAG: NAD-glutamate dehydrogenase [Propionibacteriaceae bacterium]|nr:NAD-glutamate dehydrogenase [Propionibacteriaceae bacterium]
MTNRAHLIEETAAIVASLGSDIPAARVGEFVDHYLRYVDDEDIARREPAELAGIIAGHASIGRSRRPGEITLEVRQPRAGGESTVLFVVCDDRSFIVDSVSMAITDCGWSIRDLLHPQYQVLRDADGTLRDIASALNTNEDTCDESWVVCEVFPPLGESSAELTGALVERVRRGLVAGSRAVADYGDMLTRVSDALRVLRADGVRASDRGGPIHLLEWLAEDNFTFLGFVEYTVKDAQLVPLPETALGIYAGGVGVEPEPVPAAEALVLAKDPQRSIVHRPNYLDRLSIRRIKGGKVVSEMRFVGLFASSVYTGSIRDIPFIDAKVQTILHRTGYDPAAHGAKAITATLATYPRDELLQASADELYAVVVPVSRLNERRTVRLFVRKSADGRFVNALVFFPRDRYNTSVRERMQKILLSAYGATSVEHEARIGSSSLARLYFVLAVPQGATPAEPKVAEVERELEEATGTWDDAFIRLARDLASEQRGIEFSEGYREAFPPEVGIADLHRLNALTAEAPMSFDLSDGADDVRLKVYLKQGSLTLSAVLPQLSALGFEVIDEWPYELELRGERAMVYEFSLRPVGFEIAAGDRERVVAAIAAAMRGQVEADSFSALVTKAGLGWRDVAVLRTIARYLRQTGMPFSQTYIARALASHPAIAGDLSELFNTKFDPARAAGAAKAGKRIASRLADGLDAIASLDTDRILRGYLAVINATVRTNAFAPDGPFADGSSSALALKLHPRDLDFAPEPRPLIEVYVYSPRVEGVHLRFATVARGGLRWSDRAEDYRTEVLGLVKAQMVKNTVIVPSGAKGGFFARQLPDPAADPAAWRAEGIEAYRRFITALLSITDNIVSGQIVPPAGVVSHDEPDPYLVVAADKGTASFSDIANSIAVERGFWLGDGFASGGSNGYDHKAMGITARGAWESVKRHFFELGIDCQSTDFTCVGIGDMAGDVFGNGMLASRHTRLVAAFNHKHIFLDPDPDAERSWAERKRLFELPGSAWSDYDPALISAGGGVFDRGAKQVKISPEAAGVLGIEAGTLRPDQVISAILTAPVDLLWNGGIGTYVKASAESHAEVGDRANDPVRVNAAGVRARIAGEGGNLGWTQAGRIEYARGGGRINTDFIDNSAGVDTSDHEVNIKIALAAPVEEGRLSPDERNELLRAMTDDVAAHVLAHNVDQNVALANASAFAGRHAGLHDGWMQQLTADGYLDRALEGLPDSAEMARRIDRGEGLCGPELATLLAWTKIWLTDALLSSDLPEDPFIAARLQEYFPALVRDRFPEDVQHHRLRREIITTVAVNRFVNSQGISAYFQFAEATGACASDIVRAQVASRSVFAAGRFEGAIRKLGSSAEAATTLRLELRALVGRGTTWLLQNRPRPLDIQATIAGLGEGVRKVLVGLREVLPPRARQRYDERRARFELAADDELLAVLAGAPIADRALSIADISSRTGHPLRQVAAASFQLSEALGLDLLGHRVESLPQFVRWDSLARAALLADLTGLHDELLGRYLAEGTDGVARWLESRPRLDEVVSIVTRVGEDEPGLAKASVALRAVRGLLG